MVKGAPGTSEFSITFYVLNNNTGNLTIYSFEATAVPNFGSHLPPRISPHVAFEVGPFQRQPITIYFYSNFEGKITLRLTSINPTFEEISFRVSAQLQNLWSNISNLTANYPPPAEEMMDFGPTSLMLGNRAYVFWGRGKNPLAATTLPWANVTYYYSISDDGVNWNDPIQIPAPETAAYAIRVATEGTNVLMTFGNLSTYQPVIGMVLLDDGRITEPFMISGGYNNGTHISLDWYHDVAYGNKTWMVTYVRKIYKPDNKDYVDDYSQTWIAYSEKPDEGWENVPILDIRNQFVGTTTIAYDEQIGFVACYVASADSVNITVDCHTSNDNGRTWITSYPELGPYAVRRPWFTQSDSTLQSTYGTASLACSGRGTCILAIATYLKVIDREIEGGLFNNVLISVLRAGEDWQPFVPVSKKSPDLDAYHISSVSIRYSYPIWLLAFEVYSDPELRAELPDPKHWPIGYDGDMAFTVSYDDGNTFTDAATDLPHASHDSGHSTYREIMFNILANGTAVMAFFVTNDPDALGFKPSHNTTFILQTAHFGGNEFPPDEIIRELPPKYCDPPKVDGTPCNTSLGEYIDDTGQCRYRLCNVWNNMTCPDAHLYCNTTDWSCRACPTGFYAAQTECLPIGECSGNVTRCLVQGRFCNQVSFSCDLCGRGLQPHSNGYECEPIGQCWGDKLECPGHPYFACNEETWACQRCPTGFWAKIDPTACTAIGECSADPKVCSKYPDNFCNQATFSCQRCAAGSPTQDFKGCTDPTSVCVEGSHLGDLVCINGTYRHTGTVNVNRTLTVEGQRVAIDGSVNVTNSSLIISGSTILISDHVIVQVGAIIISEGSSATVGGNFVLSPNSKLNYGLGKTSRTVQVGGCIYLNGTLQLNVTDSIDELEKDPTRTILNSTSGCIRGNFDNVTVNYQDCASLHAQTETRVSQVVVTFRVIRDTCEQSDDALTDTHIAIIATVAAVVVLIIVGVLVVFLVKPIKKRVFPHRFRKNTSAVMSRIAHQRSYMNATKQGTSQGARRFSSTSLPSKRGTEPASPERERASRRFSRKVASRRESMLSFDGRQSPHETTQNGEATNGSAVNGKDVSNGKEENMVELSRSASASSPGSRSGSHSRTGSDSGSS